jgi:hypothetical protein
MKPLFLYTLLSNVCSHCRAFTASKSEAFAAPLALVDIEPFFDGSNKLSANETRLSIAFERQNRPDLADCVRGGKVWQRLPMVVGQYPDIAMLKGLENAITGVESGEMPSFDAWAENLIKNKYNGDETLKRLRGGGE